MLRALLSLTRHRGWGIAERARPWLIPEGPVEAQVEGSRMLLDLRDAYGWRLYKWGMAYAEEYRTFCSLIGPGDTVLDVGANIGVFTLGAARRAGPTGRVIAFDPVPRNVRYLVANAALNGYCNVHVEPIAVGGHDGELEMTVLGTDSVSVSAAAQGPEGLANTRVRCCRLDSYVRSRGIERVALVKIDVEGAEALVLEGMKDLLASRGRPAVLVEVHPDLLETQGLRPRHVLRMLGDAGYRVYQFDHGRAVPLADAAAFPVPYDPAKRPLNCFRVLARPGGP